MRHLGWIVTLALAVVAGDAAAQGLTAPSIGTGASGPAHADPAAVYWNPGLIGFQRGSLLVGGHLIAGSASYQRNRRAIYQTEDSLQFSEPIAAESIDPSKTGWAEEETAHPLGLAPSVFAVYPVGKLTLGFGVYAPYAAILDFDDDGAQRWQLQHATIIAVNVNPVVAYQVNDRVSIGAGVAYVLGYADLAKVQDFATLDDVGQALANDPLNQANDFGGMAPPSVRELAVTSRPIAIDDAVGHGFTFSAGIALRPTDQLVLGLAYQHSVRMNFNGTFALDMNDDFFTQDLASQGLEFAPVVRGDATIAMTLPRSVLAGAALQLSPALELTSAFGYTTYSQTDAFDVAVRSPDLAQPKIGLTDTARISLPRRWKDTFAIDGGARFQVTKRAVGWASAGFRSAASPDATLDVASLDGDRIVGNAGLSFALTPRWTLHGELKVQHVMTREVEGSDFDLGNGRYGLTLFLAGAHLQAAL